MNIIIILFNYYIIKLLYL